LEHIATSDYNQLSMNRRSFLATAGAAGALLAAARERLGLEEVHLEVYAQNARAIAVYAACGFRVVGRAGPALRMSRSAAAGSEVLSPCK